MRNILIVGCGSSQSVLGGFANPESGSLPQPGLSEYFLHIELHLIPQNEITSLAYLARQRLGCHNLPIRAGKFALMPFFGLRTKTPDEVGRLHVCPAQIPIAVLAVVLAFLLVVGRATRFYAPAIPGARGQPLI